MKQNKMSPAMMTMMLMGPDQLPTKRYAGGNYFMFYNGHPNRNRAKNKKLNGFVKTARRNSHRFKLGFAAP